MTKAMEETLEKIDGALVRLRQGNDGSFALEFQERVGPMMRWWVCHYDTGMDGWGGDMVLAKTADEAIIAVREHTPRAIIPSNPVTPCFNDKPVGWSVERETRAKCWAGKIIADIRETERVARRFASNGILGGLPGLQRNQMRRKPEAV